MEKIGFEDYIKSQFEQRQQKNARYSLRAFAKGLKLEASLLSKIIRKKYKLTDKVISEIGQKLELSSEEINKFLEINKNKIKAEKFLTIDDEVFEAISQWYYFAILRSLDISSEINVKKLAKQLQISEAEVSEAVTCLERLNVIEHLGESKYKRLKEQILIKPEDFSPKANRELISQFIEKALDSVEKVDYNNRTHGSIVLSLKKSSLPRFQKKVSEFLFEVCQMAREDGDENDAVYNLIVNLHPLIQENVNEN